MKHKILSLVLSAVMVVTILPKIDLKVNAFEAVIDGVKYDLSTDNYGRKVATVAGYVKWLDEVVIIPKTFDFLNEIYTVTAIGNSAFAYRNDLTSIIIPETVTNIGDYAFVWCTDLTSVELSNGVTSIGNYAFVNCVDLRSIEIPASVTSIGKEAFSHCCLLEEIIVDGQNENYTSDSGVLFNKGMTELIRCPEGKTEQSYAIPSTVINITDGAFSCCENLISITIPNGTTIIGDYAFEWCTNLVSIVLPNSIIKIGNTAFGDCLSLISVIIPEGITDINESTFNHCRNLTSLKITQNVVSIGASAFDGCEKLNAIQIVSDSRLEFVDVTAFMGCSRDLAIYINCEEGSEEDKRLRGVFENTEGKIENLESELKVIRPEPILAE